MFAGLNLEGRVAVVIGGTSGIGHAIACALAEAGADVVPTGRREEHVRSSCQRVRDLGRRSLERPVDVRDHESIVALRTAVLEAFGHVDVLVNTLRQRCARARCSWPRSPRAAAAASSTSHR
jgi:NADP-dependent 3-hydroxy acid dehydrogenase YdfG